MTKRYGHPRFYELLEEIAETHSVKNHDYASSDDPLSNFKEVATATGLEPFDVIHQFCATKMARIKQLKLKKKNLVKGEGMDDSLKDLAVYALLGVVLLEEEASKSL